MGRTNRGPDFCDLTPVPLLITNSPGSFGLMRASDIGGEPGKSSVLFAALGAASAGVVFANRPVLRRLALTGGVMANHH